MIGFVESLLLVAGILLALSTLYVIILLGIESILNRKTMRKLGYD